MLVNQFLLLSLLTSAISSLELQHPLQGQGQKKTTSQPLLGFGTWQLNLSAENTTKAVSLAIQAGYRQIDGAAAYGNEVAVGKGIADGIKKAGIRREDLWVTSKLWNNDHENAAAALDKTLSDLNLDYLDLYLIHWPVSTATSPPTLDYLSTWKSMIKLPKSKALNLGICNFSPAQLSTIIAATGQKPAVHQMEMHPYLPQSAFVATHATLGINITAYSPLGGYHPDLDFPPNLLKNDVVVAIADGAGCSPAQVVLKWGILRGTSVIPKSAHENHILDNLGSLTCELGEEDVARLDDLHEKYLTRYANPGKVWGIPLFEGLEDA